MGDCMKTEKNILIAFLLNLVFSVFEFFGGFYTGSVAIVSDALHDLGDAASIGVSYFLEKKSKRQPDETFTYGYSRYSVIGSLITTAILLLGSVVVVYNAIGRMVNPSQINFDGMIVFAVVGVVVNFCAWLGCGVGGSHSNALYGLCADRPHSVGWRGCVYLCCSHWQPERSG